jgi:hypothetical protein
MYSKLMIRIDKNDEINDWFAEYIDYSVKINVSSETFSFAFKISLTMKRLFRIRSGRYISKIVFICAILISTGSFILWIGKHFIFD